MSDPNSYDPSQYYASPVMGGNNNGSATPATYGYTPVGASSTALNPQQMTMQQKLAMMLMQQNAQSPGLAGSQNQAGQVSPLSGISQMGMQAMGMMGGGR